MKKKFEIPEAYLISFFNEDIITSSGLSDTTEPDEEIIWPIQQP